MNAKRALCALVLALGSGCAGNPTWDTSVFPEQMVYGASGNAQPSAKPDPVAAAPAK